MDSSVSGTKQGFATYDKVETREDYAYNNIDKISHLRHEVITDKSASYHDALFKIIIIGDTGMISYRETFKTFLYFKP